MLERCGAIEVRRTCINRQTGSPGVWTFRKNGSRTATWNRTSSPEKCQQGNIPAEAKRKAALITGAAKRIGRETALTLVGLGVNIILHFNRSDDEARQLAAESERQGVKAWTIQA